MLTCTVTEWVILVYKESNPVTGPVVAHRGSRGIALLFQDLGARRG